MSTHPVWLEDNVAETDDVHSDLPIGDIEIDVLDVDGAGEAAGDGEKLEPFDIEVGPIEPGEPAVVEVREYQIGDIDILTGGGAEVTEDGTIVADRVTVIVDEQTGATLIDEIVGVISPDGTEIYDETISTLDADGNFAVLGEGVEVVEPEQ